MDRKRAVTEVQAENFLSLRKVNVPLDALTVLVGPNGGGKSNFLSIFRFLGEVARTDLAPAVESVFGGYPSMFFRGETASKSITLSIKAQVTEHSSPAAPDEYRLNFRPLNFHLRNRIGLLRNEQVILKRYHGRGRRITLSGGKVEFITEKNPTNKTGIEKRKPEELNIQTSSSALSVLRRIGETHDTKQISDLANIFENLRLFDPNVGMARRASSLTRTSSLESNASNLASILLRMRESTPDIFEALQSDIRKVLPGFREFRFTHIVGTEDTVRVDLLESGLKDVTPIERVSFGTIRAIALFSMLREPSPPRLTCIEEVDHGLHPHALDVLVERLREASNHTQIIIATHSPALVNRLEPNELRIFERNWETGETRFIDLDPIALSKMRDESGYLLGELWFSGALGGTP